MSFLLFATILGAAIALIFSLIAGLKDNVFAAQIALAVGLVFDMVIIGLLIYVVLIALGGIQ